MPQCLPAGAGGLPCDLPEIPNRVGSGGRKVSWYLALSLMPGGGCAVSSHTEATAPRRYGIDGKDVAQDPRLTGGLAISTEGQS
jgi:hypothetical protein